jgi:hypothetical protein
MFKETGPAEPLCDYRPRAGIMGRIAQDTIAICCVVRHSQVMREPLVQELCAADGCQNRAAIYHRDKPMSGKHALERLEQDTGEGKALPLEQ